jgi:hypothetical protein
VNQTLLSAMSGVADRLFLAGGTQCGLVGKDLDRCLVQTVPIA